MKACWVVCFVLVAACKGHGGGAYEIKRDVHRKTTKIVGLQDKTLGTFADAKPAVTITGIRGALADAMTKKLEATSPANKGNLALDFTSATPAAPSGDGTFKAVIDGKALFAQPPNMIKVEGTLDVTLTYTNASSAQIGESLADVITDWFAGDKVPADVGLPAGGVPPAKHVATGSENCSIHADGSVRCWGRDTLPSVVPAAKDTVAIDGAQNYGACGIRANGSAYCIDAWDNTVALEVRDVCGVANAKDVSVGDLYGCALLADGSVKCWGRAPEWFAPCEGAKTAFAVEGVKDAVALYVGAYTSCAQRKDGTVLCWQQDDAKTAFKPAPVKELAKARQIFVHFAPCGVMGASHVTCVPEDKKLDKTNFDVPEPIKQVAGGLQFCSLTDKGNVFCGAGQLAPVQLQGVSDAVQIDGELGGTCVVTSKGEIICWGGMSGDEPPKKVELQ